MAMPPQRRVAGGMVAGFYVDRIIHTVDVHDQNLRQSPVTCMAGLLGRLLCPPCDRALRWAPQRWTGDIITTISVGPLSRFLPPRALARFSRNLLCYKVLWRRAPGACSLALNL